MASFGDGGAVGAFASLSAGDLYVDSTVVALTALPVGHAFRAEGLDDARVTALAARYPHLPPVLVRRHDMLVVDGAHTIAAARRLGMQVVNVQWFEGNCIEALEAFVTRNAADGALPLNADDRRHLIQSALVAEPTWSDRRIAQVCGVSPKMIARSRSDVADPQPLPAVTEKRVGRDGRARPVRSGTMRAAIRQMLDEHPNASLRTIAAALGVSPETVRSVRRDGHSSRGPVTDRIDHVDRTTVPIDELALLRFQRETPAPWRGAAAFSSTATGQAFVDWFEATSVADGCHRVGDVPLSRVYEIADEARRRAAFWAEFAESVERRARRR